MSRQTCYFPVSNVGKKAKKYNIFLIFFSYSPLEVKSLQLLNSKFHEIPFQGL